jgi:hypothetical protein
VVFSVLVDSVLISLPLLAVQTPFVQASPEAQSPSAAQLLTHLPSMHCSLEVGQSSLVVHTPAGPQLANRPSPTKIATNKHHTPRFISCLHQARWGFGKGLPKVS